MDDNIIELPVQTRLDIPAERVIEGIKKSNPSVILAVVLNEEDEYEVFSSPSSVGENLLLVEIIKKRINEWIP